VGTNESNKKTGNTGLIRYANAGFVLEKTLASALADAFLQHLPAWRPSATQCFHFYFDAELDAGPFA
jgi:hypothetical protein